MNIGPLRRITAVVGLLALVPITWQLATGALTPEVAAIRAIIVAVVVVVMGNTFRAILIHMLHRVERRSDERVEEASGRSKSG